MPVEFLTDEEPTQFARYSGPPSRAELDRVFLLDNDDKELIATRRGDHMRLGFALQLATYRSGQILGELDVVRRVRDVGHRLVAGDSFGLEVGVTQRNVARTDKWTPRARGRCALGAWHG